MRLSTAIAALSAIVVLLVLSLIAFGTRHEQIVEVNVVNPYRFDVSALVECDWDHKLQLHRFKKLYILSGRTETILKIPTWVKRCALYPRLRIF